MSDGGKGSKPRPYSVSQDEFGSNWDRIFGKKNENQDNETSEANQPAESGSVVVQGLQSNAER